MAHLPQESRLLDSLVEAFHEGDEARARALVEQLRAQPRRARALLEQMFASPESRLRQAAAFGLGELGGASSAKSLEQQLAREEARGDHDGAAVVEAITQALGRLKEASARASLLRRLQRLAAGKPERSEVGELARALWRRRHPEMLPILRASLKQMASPASRPLHGLLCLLEKPPPALASWAEDASVPVEHKADVLTVLEEDVPDATLPMLAAFISAADALGDTAVHQKGAASYYCNRLLLLLLMHRERVLPALAPEARSALRPLARRLVAAVDSSCALRAAVLLEHVGRPEDAVLIEAHRPAEPVLAKVFDDAARALRHLQ
jgi:hypothetical protein